MKRIKALRAERKMSQQRLAIELNVTQAMVSKYEVGASEPDIATICRLAEIFGVSADYLLELSDDKVNVSVIGLSEAEKNLLFGFKRLNELQKAKLLAYLQGLLQE